jgi:hypothetical protein
MEKINFFQIKSNLKMISIIMIKYRVLHQYIDYQYFHQYKIKKN